MTSSTSNNHMDDVDRLFACFKCGLSPPESALRERKRRKRRVEKGSSKHESPSESPCPDSGGGEQNTPITCSKTSIESSIERIKSAVAKARSFSRGKQISPVVFYGSPHGVPPKKPTRLLWRLLQQEIPFHLPQRSKLNLRKEVWITFPRQEEAMKFAKGQDDVRVFSYQDHFNGQRRFLASTYTEFWRRYKNMDSKFRHHYEVIQEGLPCHLYFDLEFNKRINIGKNGDEMVDLLISVVLEALHEKYAIHGDHNWIVELDSSTEDKFSRHLIICIPKAAFKDNSHAGAFVSEGEEDLFMASLICNMDADCEKYLRCKTDLDCVKTLHFDTE
ncbi:DNA-directed primase/polymerase protein isoform X3, partial [Sesbania bispinosa]